MLMCLCSRVKGTQTLNSFGDIEKKLNKEKIAAAAAAGAAGMKRNLNIKE